MWGEQGETSHRGDIPQKLRLSLVYVKLNVQLQIGDVVNRFIGGKICIVILIFAPCLNQCLLGNSSSYVTLTHIGLEV